MIIDPVLANIAKDVETYIDKSGWDRGPWQHEPDSIRWTDPVTGIDCAVQRHDVFGSWCGYCRLPDGHPWELMERKDVPCLVHGGLTLKAPSDEDGQAASWLGFDCGHTWDLQPGLDAMMRGCASVEWNRYTGLREVTYRTVRFAVMHTLRLATQIAIAANRQPTDERMTRHA